LVLNLAEHLGEDFAVFTIFSRVFHLLILLVFAALFGCSFNLFALAENSLDNLDDSVESLHVGLAASLLYDLLDHSTALTGLLGGLLYFLFLLLGLVELVLLLCYGRFAFWHVLRFDAKLSVVVVQVRIFIIDLNIKI